MAYFSLNTPGRLAQLNALVAQFANGPVTATIYSGSIPPSAASPLVDQVALSTHQMSDPAFLAVDEVSVTVSADIIARDASAAASGTPSFARFVDAGGQTICDLDVGPTDSGAACEINTDTIEAGGEVAITAVAFTVPLFSST